LFITFEGIEGSGKSTQCKLLKEHLESKGRKVTVTREPGWGAMGKLIRHLILDDKELDIHPLTELYLFCADRVQHVKDFITPRIKDGEVVICDRYFDSTIVYQGYGRQLDLYTVKKLAEASTLNLVPDITFLLNLPVKEGLMRLDLRDETTNRMDEEPLEFHEMIRQGYISEATLNTNRIKIINASHEADEVQKQIRSLLDSIL
jgi:dTMP kinase